MDEEEIPLSDMNDESPEVGDIDEEIVDGDIGDDEDLKEDNEKETETPIVTIGDLYIILLESREKPFLAKLVEIIASDGIAKFEDDTDKTILFRFELNEIIKETEDYKVLDIIRVQLFEPEKEEDPEYKEIEFETEELIEKKYSDIAKKDDLLSSIIRSMNLYGNEMMINQVQEMIDELLELISKLSNEEKKLNHLSWLIPIVDDNLKLYDEGDELLKQELTDQYLAMKDKINNYRDYIHNSLQYSKPIETTTGHGCITDEYSEIFLRNCIQEDNCSGLYGPYTYDERRNSKPSMMDNEVILAQNKLRIIGYLEEPIDKTVYSINPDTLSDFTVFEKYVYDYSNKSINFKKKKIMKESQVLLSSEDDKLDPDYNTFILRNLSETSELSEIINFKEDMYQKIIDLLIGSQVSSDLYNLNDIKKSLFKYKLNYSELSLTERDKIKDILYQNIKRYSKEYIKHVKQLPKEPITIKKLELTDEKRVSLSYDHIFKIIQREKRNHYLHKFIDRFTRSADKTTESPNYLYNKYTDEPILCCHHLYMVNITNHNNVFQTMKSTFGSPPEDGYISCKICGEYLCEEDSTLFDGYDGDKPNITREVIEDKVEKKIEISEYISKREKNSTIIKLISNSLGVSLEDENIYEILQSYEFLDHGILPDIRYNMQRVSSTDIHPRVNKEIASIKEKEKKEKKKELKKQYKKDREDIINKFQIWLKDTNTVLLLTIVTAIYIQTGIPTFFTGRNQNKTFQLIDVKDKTIDKDALNYLTAKLKRISEKYKSERIWDNVQGLFNEKEYGTNELPVQLGLTTKYCMEPNFPTIISRISRYEEFLESEKHKYLKEEWTMFRPLQGNKLVQNITDYLQSINEYNREYLKKVYGGVTIENNSIIRPIKNSYDISISELCEIPEVGILKNYSFKKLFRYVVSLYGIHPNNVFITMTIQRLIETSDKSKEIVTLLEKYGWNSSTQSFPKLNFQTLRNNIIPEILSMYGDKKSEIKSCYTDNTSCNSFIHNSINTYDLSLLNTYPKRIYGYKGPNIFPELAYGRLNDERKELIDKLFNHYKENELGDLIHTYNDIFYDQFMIKNSLIEADETIKYEKLTDIERSEETFELLLSQQRVVNSLPYKEIINPKNLYSDEDYNKIKYYSSLEYRFFEYLYRLDIDKLSEKQQINHENLQRLLDDVMKTDKTPASEERIQREWNVLFSEIIVEKNENIDLLAHFIATSDSIEPDQKRRFESIFREYNPGQRVNFKKDDLISVISLFINDTNLKYSHLMKYMIDIQQIFSNLINTKETIIALPKEWNMTDQMKLKFQEFMDRDGNHVNLFLHNKIFIPSKDPYTGFNRYKNENTHSCKFFELLLNYVREFFKNMDMIRGSDESQYSQKYADIYMKYHFMNFFGQCVRYIRGVQARDSEITSDSNDLFQSLEQRDETLNEELIDTLSKFVMDLLTHVLYGHYDPSWLFLNEQKLDLANRLSKQKEREKQIIVENLSKLSREERHAQVQKQKMGISSWHHEMSAGAGEYVESEEYLNHNEDERYERLKEISSKSNIELDVLHSEEDKEEIEEVPQAVIDPMNEAEGYVDFEEYDEDNENHKEDYLDDEQEQVYNE